MPADDQPGYGDPVAVILARMEAKLDASLAEQQRHGTVIDRHERIIGEHGNRITRNETTLQPIPNQIDAIEARKYVSPAAFYGALTFAVACLGVLVAFLAIYAQSRP